MKKWMMAAVCTWLGAGAQAQAPAWPNYPLPLAPLTQDGSTDDVMNGHSPATHAERLRGELTPLRSAFDVTHYDIRLRLQPAIQSIKGSNTITFRALQPLDSLQLDLFPQMVIDQIELGSTRLSYSRILGTGAVFVALGKTINQGEMASVKISYHGKPNIAKNPPWEGGFTWTQDPQGNPWIGVSCQGHGASSWWPCKDHLSDEPDSVRFSMAVPQGLAVVSNGIFRSLEVAPDTVGYNRYTWATSYPINTYNVTFYVGNYDHLQEAFTYPDGTRLALDYYVLAPNKAKAQKHFAQVKDMLACWDKTLGHYPFIRDGYALVESPYWGMEHQGAIAYGNRYTNANPFVPGQDLGWDYIIVHESGHEWFGNLVSVADNADLWIQEGFTTYTEYLFAECYQGVKAAQRHLAVQRESIENHIAFQGPRERNIDDGTMGDMYFKGAAMLHSLRTWVGDSAFFSALRGMLGRFGHRTTSTEEVVAHWSQALGRDMVPFFRQYINFAQPPHLRYLKEKGPGGTVVLRCHWENGVPGFAMPVELVAPDGTVQRIHPTTTPQSFTLKGYQPNSPLRWTEGGFYFLPRGE